MDTKRRESQKRTPVVLVLVLVAGKTRNNEKMEKLEKKKKKNVTKSKEIKELREGSLPQQEIFPSAITGEGGLRGGRIAEHVFRSGRDLGKYGHSSREAQ